MRLFKQPPRGMFSDAGGPWRRTVGSDRPWARAGARLGYRRGYVLSLGGWGKGGRGGRRQGKDGWDGDAITVSFALISSGARLAGDFAFLLLLLFLRPVFALFCFRVSSC